MPSRATAPAWLPANLHDGVLVLYMVQIDWSWSRVPAFTREPERPSPLLHTTIQLYCTTHSQGLARVWGAGSSIQLQLVTCCCGPRAELELCHCHPTQHAETGARHNRSPQGHGRTATDVCAKSTDMVGQWSTRNRDRRAGPQASGLGSCSRASRAGVSSCSAMPRRVGRWRGEVRSGGFRNRNNRARQVNEEGQDHVRNGTERCEALEIVVASSGGTRNFQ
jgi:hypothetical protein